MISIIFFASIFLIIYSYAIYPVILSLLSCIFRKDVTNINDVTLHITLIISAFNEEDVITRKIENSLKLGYPKEMLEIMVVSDHSTDKTDEIARGYSNNGVVLLSSQERRGKTTGLNEAVIKANGEIIIFSDADAMYPSDVLRKMMKLFSDPAIGLVTGSTQYMAEGNGKMVETSSIYTKLEQLIKRLESTIGSCVGADGAIFAMRKSLYKTLKDDDINDLVIPLKVVKQGYRVVLGDNIFCSEASSLDSKSEFNRQVRITNRTLRALFRHRELMNFIKYPLFSFELISHKLIRLSAPFLLLLLIPLNMLLIEQGFIYKLILTGQGVFYFSALIGFYQEINGYKNNKLSFVYHFVMVQVSILWGWWNYFSGKKQVTWNTQNQ